MARDFNSGHQLLLTPANWCPMFASRTMHRLGPTRIPPSGRCGAAQSSSATAGGWWSVWCSRTRCHTTFPGRRRTSLGHSPWKLSTFSSSSGARFVGRPRPRRLGECTSLCIKHGLSARTMARITSDCGQIRATGKSDSSDGSEDGWPISPFPACVRGPGLQFGISAAVATR